MLRVVLPSIFPGALQRMYLRSQLSGDLTTEYLGVMIGVH